MKDENTKIAETFLNPLTGIYEEILKRRPEEILEIAFKPHVNIGIIGHLDISRPCALFGAALGNPQAYTIIQPIETPTPEDLSLVIKELANSYIKPNLYLSRRQPTTPFYSGIYKQNKREEYKPNKKYTGRKR
jgi:hypothetical protein